MLHSVPDGNYSLEEWKRCIEEVREHALRLKGTSLRVKDVEDSRKGGVVLVLEPLPVRRSIRPEITFDEDD